MSETEGPYLLRMPYPPSVNHLYYTDKDGNRRLSKKGSDYKKDAWKYVREAGIREPVLGPVAVHIDLFRPKKRGDIDNTLKALLDSLSKNAWEDDAQILELHVILADDPVNPEALVTIHALDPASLPPPRNQKPKPASKKTRRSGDKFDPRDVAILGGDPSL